MTPRIVAALAALTAVAVIAAAIAVARLPGVTAASTGDEPAFPALRAAPDAVARIAVSSAAGSFRLVRDGAGTWTAPGRHGYPVDPALVRELVVALADMRLVAPRTRQADRWPRLEVEDVEAPDAKSRLVRLGDGEGTPLARALFGKIRYRLTGNARQGIYLRRPDDDQAWLASGGPRIRADVGDWLLREVVDVPRDEVRKVEVFPADGPAYAAERGDAGDSLVLTGLAGAPVAGDAPTAQLASALAGVDLEDVRPEAEFAWPASASRVVVETFGGVSYEARVATADDDEAWLAVAAFAAGDDAAGAAEAAEAVNARTSGWVYRVPDYVAARLTRPLADYLADGS